MPKKNQCPICGGQPTAEFTPFCGRGCKDRDLLQWLGEGYRLPGDPVDPDMQSGLDTGNDGD